MQATGALLCLASAGAFGAMGVVGKLAYGEDATVGTLLATRFVVAAGIFWLILLCTGRLRQVRTLGRRDLGLAFALGAVCYGVQAGSAFAALERLDASLFSLLLHTYPVFVTVTAIALEREPANGRTIAALALASTGLVLVLAGPAAGTPDVFGTAFALGAALVYSAYVLASGGIATRVDPVVLSTVLCTGAAATLTLGSLVGGDLHPGRVSREGFAWLSCLALVSTVGAISLFFAGLRRAGPTATSILSTFEPVVTVMLAIVVFGESLGSVQLVGGALVLVAVLALRTQGQGPRREKR